MPASEKNWILYNAEPYSTAVRNLIEQAHPVVQQSDPSFDITFQTTNITLSASRDGQSFISSMIGLTNNSNFSDFTVSITVPAGYYLLFNGKQVGANEVASTVFPKGSQFQLVIPIDAINPSNRKIQVTIHATAVVERQTGYSYTHDGGGQAGLLA